jgi:methyl-accepting chemotaxis protein
MSFQILEIAVYNSQGNRNSVRLKPGVVNIITGGSKTGKSALIDIVDYCLGRSDYVVAHGVIRDTVIWYALLLQAKSGNVLIARPIPPEGQKTGSDVFFSPVADDRLPEFSDLKTNSTTKGLTAFLSEFAGITPNQNVPPEGQSRSAVRATIDHTKFYLFQQQNRVSDKNLLFYRQEESWAPQTIKDSLPYFLGAVGDDQLDRQLRLQRARRDLKLLERQLADEEAIRGRDNSKALGLFAEAQQAGILSDTLQPEDFDSTVAVLGRCLQWNATPFVSEPASDLERLTQQKDVFQEQLRQVKREVEAAKAFGRDQDGFSREVSEQHNRLSAIGLLGKHATNPSSCPLCSQPLSEEMPQAQQINSSLIDLDRQMQAVSRQRPRLDEYINQKESTATDLRQRVAETRASIEAVISQQEVLKTLRSEEAMQARVVGRVSLFLESVRATEDHAELRDRIDEARQRVEDLEESLSDDVSSERLSAALKIIGDYITQWSRRLRLEHSENPLEFDLKQLTVLSYRDSGAIPLSQMGSGENWVGYHLTTLFALHKWFVEKDRPVPRFLMIDQPAQYYFPSDIPKDSDIDALPDEEREAVNRMFRFVFDTIAGMDGKFQVIITEHADLRDEWYQDAVVLRWRGDDKLIPLEWYQSSPDAMNDEAGDTGEPSGKAESSESE